MVALLLLLLLALPAMADDGAGLPPPLLGSRKIDAYGPGLHSDATGRPFRYRADDGTAVPPGVRVSPNAYGLGVDMDEYGRPVRAEPDDELDEW